MGSYLEIEPAYADLLADAGIDSPQALYDYALEGEMVSRTFHSLRVRQHHIGDTGTYAKKYEYPRFSTRFLCRRSRAWRERQSYRHLERLGIPHADVMALAERHFCGPLLWAVILVREIEGTTDLIDCYAALPPEHRPALCRDIGRYVARMHNGAFFYRSCRFRNILHRPSDDGPGELFFIDSPGGRQSRLRPRRQALYDLMCLYQDAVRACSLDEWLALLDGYANERDVDLNPEFTTIPERCRKRFGKRYYEPQWLREWLGK